MLLCTLYLKAQTLSGPTDSLTKESVPGAIVYFPDIKAGAQTDTGGYFRLTNLPKRELIVQVTVVGYATFSQKINCKYNAYSLP